MENINTNTTAENQQVNTQPEENGTQRTFTQEEVNQIISDRLKREQNKKADNSEYETRMNDLKARESAFACKEFVKSNDYPEELLDIIDTSDSKKFIETVEKINEIYGKPNLQIIPQTLPERGDCDNSAQLIANAFKPQ